MTEYDSYLWRESKHFRSYRKLGAHVCHRDGEVGVQFAVWAPNAQGVCVMGDFNGWNRESHPLSHFDPDTGIWSAFFAGPGVGTTYKYCVWGRAGAFTERCDPYGHWSEMRPANASRVWDLGVYDWQDGDWMNRRKDGDIRKSPMSVYEVHPGSWMRKLDHTWMTYRDLADKLVGHVAGLGSTHVELLPITEHPLDASWGYQTTGYFAATSRFGTPDDLRYLIDRFHQMGIGVILDWVPAHFPTDGHGLAHFDGSHLFEHADPRRGVHPDWGTLLFNYARPEVRNFLTSSALFWLDEYHIDGLRVDAVASMLYLDFGRKEGEWCPNHLGGRENLEAITFLREMNAAIRREHPGAFTVAEESTAFPAVTRNEAEGGLGFTFKWNMGWTHDCLEYFQKESMRRKAFHQKLTFGMMYQYSEDFLLPFSHDEVVHQKKSMLSKMPGDEWQMRANLRLLLGYMFGFPGKKLLFMGTEFAQWSEWSENRALDWELLGSDVHRAMLSYARSLHHLYREKAAFFELDNHPEGFRWIDCDDAENSFIAFLRQAHSTRESLLFLYNCVPSPRKIRLQLPWGGEWNLLVNSDDQAYGGSGVLPFSPRESLKAEAISHRGQPWSAEIVLPPLATVILSGQRPE